MLRALLPCLAVILAVALPGRAQQPASDDIYRYVDASNDFAISLHNQIGRSRSANVCFSPLGANTLVRLACAGSTDDTRKELEKALRAALDPQQRHAVHDYVTDLILKGRGDAVSIALRNDVFVDTSVTVNQNFRILAADHYLAAIHQLDFAGHPDEAVASVNAGIAKATGGKFPELLQVGPFSGRTAIVFTNCLYFKAGWASAFTPADTRDADFYLSKDDKVTVPMMTQRQVLACASTDTANIVDLPFQGKDFAMLLILPKEPFALDHVEKTLTGPRLRAWYGALRPANVSLALPRFAITSSNDLRRDLMGLGVERAFRDDQAQLRGILDDTDIYISQFRQQVAFSVTEAGVEAAAASAVEMAFGGEGTALPSFTFHARQPFMYLIHHRASGHILFMGRYANPERL